MIAIGPSGLDHFRWVAQGSQSLTLGFTLIAAPQFGECSRLNIVLPFKSVHQVS
jgi:hypothetical protein